MKKLMLPAILLPLFASPAIAQAPAKVAAATASMTCTPFRWATVGDQERAAMLVPVTLAGHSYEFQLDTGSESSFIPEADAVEAGLMKAGDGGARVEDVRLAALPSARDG